MPLSFRAIRPKRPLVVTADMETGIKREMDIFGAETLNVLKTYPPQRPGSRYRRTRTLGRSWSQDFTKRESNMLVMRIGSSSNIAPYNEAVQGSKQRPLMKRLGWKTPDDVITRFWPTAVRQIGLIISRATGR